MNDRVLAVPWQVVSMIVAVAMIGVVIAAMKLVLLLRCAQ